MCGIIGAFSVYALTEKEKKAVRDLIYIDTVRGRDSTGCIVHNPQTSVTSYYKALGLPDQMESVEGYWETFKGGISLFVGHNRKATTGKVVVDNAHPFQKEHIFGVHNGTLDAADIRRLVEFTELTIAEADDLTDSEILYDVLSRHDIQKIWENITGAATLVWFNTEEQSLNFASNGQRPFSYWISPTQRIFFASEAWMLKVGIARTHEKAEVIPVSITNNTHLKITKSSDSKIHVAVTELTPRPAEKWESFYGANYYQGGWYRGNYHFPPQNSREEEEKRLLGDTAKSVKVRNGRIVREDGSTLSFQEFHQEKCMFCHQDLELSSSVLYSEDLQLCFECDEISAHCETTI